MDDPPLPGLRGCRVRAAYRVNLAAAFGTVLTSCGGPGGVLLTLYLQDILGAAKWQIGLVMTMTFLGPVLEPLGAWLSKRLDRRKTLFLSLFLLSRTPFILLALLPLFDMDERRRPLAIALVLGIVGFTRCCHLANPAWWSWIADLVPERRRARFFGIRLQATSAVAALSFALAMVLLCGCGGLENRALVSCLFAAGALFGIADILVYLAVPEPPNITSQPKTVLSPLPEQPAPGFGRFVLGMGLWSFSANLAIPFLPIFQHGEMRDGCPLGLSLSWQFLAVLSVGASVAAMMTSRFWGRLSERLGPRHVLLIGSGYLFVNLAYLLVGPHRRLSLLIPVALVNGSLNAAWTVAANYLLLSLSPRVGRSVYISAYNSVIGVLMAGGPLLGGIAADLLPILHVRLPGGHPLCYFHVLLTISSLGGLLALRLLATLPTPAPPISTKAVMAGPWRIGPRPQTTMSTSSAGMAGTFR